jgi:SH3-like domain-containing protein
VPVTKAAPPVVHAQPSAHAQKPPAKPAAASAPPAPPTAPVVAPVPAAHLTPPPSAKPAEGEKDTETRPLPRFQSLRSNEVNLRAGPGQRYRIDWVYKRTDLPVKVEREFEHWRLIRDADDIQGWVNQATLTARRSFIVKGADATLRDDAKEAGAAVAILQPGVIGRIRSCAKTSDWCRVQTAGHTGYLRRSQFFGTLPGEEIAP